MAVELMGSHQRCLIIAGPGGTGKTTLSAASALQLVERRSRVLCITVDPSQRLKDLFGVSDVAAIFSSDDLLKHGIRPHADLSDALTVQVLDPAKTFERLIRRFASDERAQRILKSPLYRSIAGNFAGTHAYMAVDALFEASRDHYDAIIIDTPPDTDALDILVRPKHLSFLEAPQWMQEGSVYQHVGHRLGGLVGRFIKGVAQGLTQFTGAKFLNEALTLLEDFVETLRTMRHRAEAVERLFKDPSTSIWLVTRPSATMLEATLTLNEALNREHYSTSGFIFNACHPWMRLSEAETAELAKTVPHVDPELATAIAQVLAEEKQSADQQHRLWMRGRAQLNAQTVHVDRLPHLPLSLAEVRAMADMIRQDAL